MSVTNVVRAVVKLGSNYTVTAPIVKEDYGLYLKIEGVELPPTYQVDFSNSESNGTSVTMIGNADGVLIPHQFIDTGKDIFAFMYHVGSDFGRTVYKFRIPNKLRPDRTKETPTPEEQSVIDQTINALNDAVEQTQDAQQAIENMSVSAQTLAEGSSATVTKTESEGVVHLEFGIPRGATGAQGERGEKGDKGDTGATGATGAQGERGLTGADGYSPTVTITPITGGHRITITDKDGSHSADVMDGQTPTVPVEDVQINGTSIVADGVANVPIASASRLGVIKASNANGIYVNSDGDLSISEASSANVKTGTNVYKPITPHIEHEAAFYGLAKSAGDTTQSASINAVGQYTDTAKGKIHDMLGIGIAEELRAYSELGEDMDLIEIPLPDRYEKVWFRFQCRINNAENNIANGQTQMLAWLGDSTNFSPGQNPSIYDAVYIRQLDTFMIKGWFVVDFPFVERFSTGSYSSTNWYQFQAVRSQDGSYHDKITSYPRSLFIRPYDTSNGYLFKANSKLGVYIK